ncbi:hypothetical protein [Streptomyces sp. NPDC002690]
MDVWQKLSAQVEERLATVSAGERGVFAAAVAERLMRRHEALPEDERAPFTLSLRPLLDSVWDGVLGDPSAFSAVNRGVAAYMLSEYCHNDGQNGPDEADESAAAATLHAAHAYLFGCRDFAVWTGERAVEAVDQHLQDLAERADDGDEGVGLLADTDEALACELRRQLRDLDLIAGFAGQLRHAAVGLPLDTSARLRGELRAPLSSQE